MGSNRAILLFGLSLFLAGAALAQDVAPTGEEAPPPATVTEEAGPSASGDGAATDQPGPAPQADDSPFDYESSEQISEDLSVSFPVDI